LGGDGGKGSKRCVGGKRGKPGGDSDKGGKRCVGGKHGKPGGDGGKGGKRCVGGKRGKPGGDGGKGGKRCVGGKHGKSGGDGGKGDKRFVGGKRGKPGGDGGKGGKGCVGGKRGKPGGNGQSKHPVTANAMADLAAMTVDVGVADGRAGIDGAHAAAGGHPEVDCFTDSEVLRQFRPLGSYYAHAEPVEVVDGVPRVTDNRLYDMCVGNRARAHARRVYAHDEALPDFVDVMAQAGLPDHAGDRVAEVRGDP